MMMMMMGAPRSARMLLTLMMLILSYTANGVRSSHVKPEGRKHWWKLGQNDLMSALNVRLNWNVAKNVIMFLGDGMGLPAVAASRIYKGQKEGRNGEEGYLAWERFPNVALLKTYNVDRQVPDSAATATAYLCGVKANMLTLGVGPEVEAKDCKAASDTSNHVSSILQWAQDAGLHTGLVTTTRVTHATPAALYAHSAYRSWECDADLGEKGEGCKDIADQLVSDLPGRSIRVILGGGRQVFGAGTDLESANKTCSRLDGRNLTEEWLSAKTWQGLKARYVTTSRQLEEVEAEDTDYLLGLFADSHLPYLVEREEDSDVPSLPDMTLKALEILKKSHEGFFLLVEGGRIDHGQHSNSPYRALEEALDFDRAVAAALKEVDLEETMVVVTADHSHVMSINGYPTRGSDILGTTGINSTADGLQYSTLMFANGPGYTYSSDGENVTRQDPSQLNPRDLHFKSQAAVPLKSETHGGEDVGLWAAGPMSHLFHRTHEQHYVAHAMAYAACVGASAGHCTRPSHATFTRRGTIRRPALVDDPPTALHPPEAQDRVTLHTPRFPTIDPAFQQELDDEEDQLIRELGEEVIASPDDHPLEEDKLLTGHGDD